MQTRPISFDDLAGSVVAMPPVAWDRTGLLAEEENARILQHLESGQVRHLLYGANANFAHLGVQTHRAILEYLAGAAGSQTLVTPSVGPSYGVMMEQAAAVRETGFPTSMVLPMQGMTDPKGVVSGLRHYARTVGHPIVICLEDEDYLTVEGIGEMAAEGLLAWVLYAIPRAEPKEDAFLKRLAEVVDPASIVSGLGEQVATVHLTRFGMAGFSTSCGVIAPSLSQWMLEALRSGHFAKAEELRRLFEPLEALRREGGPIRVLHRAVGCAGIAEIGMPMPLLSALGDTLDEQISDALQVLHKSMS